MTTSTPFILTDAVVAVDAYDLTGNVNNVSATMTVDDKKFATFGTTAFQRVGGLKDWNINVKGYFTAPGNSFESGLPTASAIITTVAPTSADGITGYFCRTTREFHYQTGTKVGDLMPYMIDVKGADALGLIRGTVLNPKGNTYTSSGTGAVRQLGAVSSTQSVYAAVHFLKVADTGATPAPTLAVVVQSAPSAGFASPTSRITFNTATGIGAQFSSTAGAITDQYWRVSYTIGGMSPSMQFLLTVGIY